VSGPNYYTSILFASLVPVLALVPAMYALYLDRYTEMLLLLVASATALACLFADVFNLWAAGGGGGGGVWMGGMVGEVRSSTSAADEALTISVTLVAAVSGYGLSGGYEGAVGMGLVLASFLLAAAAPTLLSAPVPNPKPQTKPCSPPRSGRPEPQTPNPKLQTPNGKRKGGTRHSEALSGTEGPQGAKARAARENECNRFACAAREHQSFVPCTAAPSRFVSCMHRCSIFCFMQRWCRV
jgi:hypothetical protein